MKPDAPCMNRMLFRKLLECGGKGVKGARHRFGKRAHHPRSKAASPFAPVALELCRRAPKRGLDWTNPFPFMGSMREPLIRGILSPHVADGEGRNDDEGFMGSPTGAPRTRK